MKISVNKLAFINNRYGSAGNPAANGVTDLVDRLGAQLGAVEEVIPFGERFSGVVVVKVVSCVAHPDSDHLHICKVDDAGRVEGVERDENGLVQVVCGAPNVREGLTVAWLPPGATVPETYVTGDPFVLESRMLRGEMSNGMLASARELSLGDSHDGILELEDDVAAGTLFADAYNLAGDMVIDMENKMFTHRPDCFGWLGIAREIEGIYNRPYKSPDWYTVQPDFPGVETDELPLEIRNDVSALVPRFTAVALRDVTVKPSPVPIQIALAAMGLRPINNIVDYTNFFMLETGQPLHAYDYDKVKALSGSDHPVLVVRHPAEGETITLLNGKQITPRAEAVMIATDRQLIGVGGVMGGADTEVDEHTKNIIIECANFDMYSIRRTAMAHGLFTDAVTRFNKGQSPLQNRTVIAKIVDEIRQYADGKVASPLIDINHVPDEIMERGSLHAPVTVTVAFVNERLGWDLSADQMTDLLTNVECTVQTDGDTLTVSAPFWRTDIEFPEDVVEEIGRLRGYDHLHMELPRRDLTPAAKNPLLSLKGVIRDVLAAAGANEVLTYSFVHGNLFDKAGQSREQAFQIGNALSPDLQYYRLSLAPSLLDRVHPNLKAGYDRFALFEMNKTHNLLHADDDNGLPREFPMLACVVAAADKAVQDGEGAAFYEARAYLEQLASQLGIELEYTAMPAEAAGVPVMKPYDTSRSALVQVKGGEVLGVLGEFRPAVRRSMKLPVHTAGFEIDLQGLLQTSTNKPRYTVLPRFPKVSQDITLRVPAATQFGDVERLLISFVQGYKDGAYFTTVQAVDAYQGSDAATKNLTFRIAAASYDRTLTDDEVNVMLDSAAASAHDAFGAERL